MTIVHDAVDWDMLDWEMEVGMPDQALRRLPRTDQHRRRRIWALFNTGRLSENAATIRLLRLDLDARAKSVAIAKGEGPGQVTAG